MGIFLGARDRRTFFVVEACQVGCRPFAALLASRFDRLRLFGQLRFVAIGNDALVLAGVAVFHAVGGALMDQGLRALVRVVFYPWPYADFLKTFQAIEFTFADRPRNAVGSFAHLEQRGQLTEAVRRELPLQQAVIGALGLVHAAPGIVMVMGRTQGGRVEVALECERLLRAAAKPVVVVVVPANFAVAVQAILIHGLVKPVELTDLLSALQLRVFGAGDPCLDTVAVGTKG
ncbi:hypothetical protein D3C79_829620 [compost metagenome]